MPPKKTETAANDLMRVSVQVGARRFEEDLAAQAMIRPNIEALNEALATNPSRFAEWAMLEALARTELDKLNSNLDRLDADTKELEARIYLEVVAPPPDADAKWKPPTVDAVKASVQTDERRLAMVRSRLQLEDAIIAAKDGLRTLEVGRKTIEEKRDSLMELSRNWRQEMQTKLSVSGQAGGDMSRFKPAAPQKS